ncbi:CRISPR-associated helicase Cas3' [Acidithiobacillus thiooxidans]
MLGKPRKTNLDSENEGTRPLPLDQCLAKTWKCANGEIKHGRLVLSHCTIVGMVARELIRQMPDWLCTDIFPENAHLIAAAHDIGKVSPTFQKKIYSALSTPDTRILENLRRYNAEVEKQWGGHAGVSQSTAAELKVGRYIPEILGQHHGFSPDLGLRQANSEIFGGASWNAARKNLLNQLAIYLGCENAPWPTVRDPLQAMVLSGLTTVSDWIGSGPLFEDPEYLENEALIQKAVIEAGFVSPSVRSRLSFQDIFDFPANPIQIKMAEGVQQPGVYVLEAPMGVGKTEAALFAAYQMLEQKKATGIYFALPTQLTSDKIHERVNAFLQKILTEDSPHRAALLIHGQSWLKSVNTVMGEEGNPGGAWFAQGKRGILAPFAVGTIDQALMAVMNVKHGFVRTFGLAGKVVILDEVHSYDSYTGTIMDVLVEALQKLRCTVIILSATLTQSRRNQIMGLADNTEIPSNRSSSAYPLITAVYDNAYHEIPVGAPSDSLIAVSRSADITAIEEALVRAESGQQVLWIENTVHAAQSMYRILAARSSEIQGISCGLLHSRFTRRDRAQNESLWVAHFGKEGAAHRSDTGRILVGTQVLEQSLDIDADFLITRIAPTDMLLQRMGRLWRHSSTRRPSSARREAWILSPPMDAVESDIEKTLGSSAKVYDPYVLYRSLEVWNQRTQIQIPGQLRETIEATYADQTEENPSISRYLHQLEKNRERLRRLALIGLSRGGKTLPEEKAQTRHSDLETTQVLLLRSYRMDKERKGAWVELMDGSTIFVPQNGRSLGREKWQGITVTLMQNVLNVAMYHAPSAMNRQEISWLGDYFYLGNPDYDENVPLRLGLVDEDGAIRHPIHKLANDTYRLSYYSLIGYTAEKR